MWHRPSPFSESNGARVLRQPGQGEVRLEVGGPVVDVCDPTPEAVGQALGVDQLAEGGGRVEVRDDDRCGQEVAVTELDAPHRAVVDDDPPCLGVTPELPAMGLEETTQVLGDGPDATLDLGHGDVAR